MVCEVSRDGVCTTAAFAYNARVVQEDMHRRRDWALIGDVGMRLVAITVREKRLCEKWESHDMNGVPMKHDGADAPRGACTIIRMVRVRSASGREGLVVRLGVCL